MCLWILLEEQQAEQISHMPSPSHQRWNIWIVIIDHQLYPRRIHSFFFSVLISRFSADLVLCYLELILPFLSFILSILLLPATGICLWLRSFVCELWPLCNTISQIRCTHWHTHFLTNQISSQLCRTILADPAVIYW